METRERERRVLSAPSAAHTAGRCEAPSWEAQTHQQKPTAVWRTAFPPSPPACGGQSTLRCSVNGTQHWNGRKKQFHGGGGNNETHLNLFSAVCNQSTTLHRVSFCNRPQRTRSYTPDMKEERAENSARVLRTVTVPVRVTSPSAF